MRDFYKADEKPLVSIIMPCYNHAKYVQQSIRSVLNQTYQKIELIILNDGSRDDTHERISELEEKCKNRFFNFIYINKENEGLTKTLNKGLLLSKGKYVSLLASDDLIANVKIELLVEEFEKLDEIYAVLCGDVNFIDDNEQKLYFDKAGNRHYDNNEIASVSDYIRYYGNNFNFDFDKTYGTYRMLIQFNHICDLATMIRREAILDVGMYDENVGLEDVDMWFKLAKKYRMKYVDHLLGLYRYHGSNSVNIYQEKLMVDRIRLYIREKEYCYANDMVREWDNKYTELLVVLIRNKNFNNIFEYIRYIHPVKFANILALRFIKKMARLTNLNLGNTCR